MVGNWSYHEWCIWERCRIMRRFTSRSPIFYLTNIYLLIEPLWKGGKDRRYFARFRSRRNEYCSYRKLETGRCFYKQFCIFCIHHFCGIINSQILNGRLYWRTGCEWIIFLTIPQFLSNGSVCSQQWWGAPPAAAGLALATKLRKEISKGSDPLLTLSR